MRPDALLRLGVAGTGAFAARAARAVASCPQTALSGILSGDQARADASAREHGTHGQTDMTALANHADAVWVAGATGAHAATAQDALRAGLAVLCEKPMGTDAAQTEATIAAARETGVLLMEGFWPCHLPSWQAARDAVRTGRFGARARLAADFGVPTSREEAPRLFGPDDGVLRDRGVYPVCLALWLFGPATLEGAEVRREDGVDVEATLRLRHEGGARSTLLASMTRRTPNQAIIRGGSEAMTILPPLLASERVADRARPVPAPARLPLLTKVAGRALTIGARRLPHGDDPYHPQLAHLAALVRAGRAESDVVPHDLSLGVARIVEEARAA